MDCTKIYFSAFGKCLDREKKKCIIFVRKKPISCSKENKFGVLGYIKCMQWIFLFIPILEDVREPHGIVFSF